MVARPTPDNEPLHLAVDLDAPKKEASPLDARRHSPSIVFAEIESIDEKHPEFLVVFVVGVSAPLIISKKLTPRLKAQLIQEHARRRGDIDRNAGKFNDFTGSLPEPFGNADLLQDIYAARKTLIDTFINALQQKCSPLTASAQAAILASRPDADPEDQLTQAFLGYPETVALQIPGIIQEHGWPSKQWAVFAAGNQFTNIIESIANFWLSADKPSEYSDDLLNHNDQIFFWKNISCIYKYIKEQDYIESNLPYMFNELGDTLGNFLTENIQNINYHEGMSDKILKKIESLAVDLGIPESARENFRNIIIEFKSGEFRLTRNVVRRRERQKKPQPSRSKPTAEKKAKTVDRQLTRFNALRSIDFEHATPADTEVVKAAGRLTKVHSELKKRGVPGMEPTPKEVLAANRLLDRYYGPRGTKKEKTLINKLIL